VTVTGFPGDETLADEATKANEESTRKTEKQVPIRTDPDLIAILACLNGVAKLKGFLNNACTL